jgi:tetratricopeptide (TPR) repeat protein
MEFYNRGLKSFLAYKKIEYFTKAIQLNPNLTEAYEKRAIHYYLQWQFDKAIQDYSKVLELKPRATNAYLMKGLAYFKKEYGEGYSTEIKNLAFHLSKQEVPEFSKSLERAIDNFSYAIDLDPQLASAYSYRAKAYRIKGMLEEAVRDSNMVIQLRRDQQSTARAYATLAKIHRKLGQDELSEANYRKSVELDPYSPDYPPLHVPLIYPCVSDTPTLEIISRLGLVGIIILALVVIFKLTLPAPKK